MFVFCVLCLRSAFCVMLGARRMLGATENMEFNNINILSVNTKNVHSSSKIKSLICLF